MNIHWKDWCWSWSSNTLATWCEELIHLKRLWCWERLRAGGEGDERRRDGLNASLTEWTWVWEGCRSWCWTGRPGMLQLMELQRVGHDWATEVNRTVSLALLRSTNQERFSPARAYRSKCLWEKIGESQKRSRRLSDHDLGLPPVKEKEKKGRKVLDCSVALKISTKLGVFEQSCLSEEFCISQSLTRNSP